MKQNTGSILFCHGKYGGLIGSTLDFRSTALCSWARHFIYYSRGVSPQLGLLDGYWQIYAKGIPVAMD